MPRISIDGLGAMLLRYLDREGTFIFGSWSNYEANLGGGHTIRVHCNPSKAQLLAYSGTEHTEVLIIINRDSSKAGVLIEIMNNLT